MTTYQCPICGGIDTVQRKCPRCGVSTERVDVDKPIAANTVLMFKVVEKAMEDRP